MRVFCVRYKNMHIVIVEVTDRLKSRLQRENGEKINMEKRWRIMNRLC